MGSMEDAMTSANANDLDEKARKAQIKDQSDSEEELFQDVVSQFPFLNGYSHVAFIFQPEAHISRESIIATVQDGLDKIMDQIPWLADQVLHTSGPAGSSGL
jgi:hypothetical protein